jgi:CheY-like chemotaxis protein
MEKPTILCVDSDVNALSRREALLKKGYNVLITTSGRQSLQLLASLPVDAVILNPDLPGMNRGILTSRMKQLRPRVPILLLCPYGMLPDSPPDCVDGFLSDSDPPERLAAAVQEMVSGNPSFFNQWWWDWRRRLTA